MTSISVCEGWEGRTVGGKFPLLEWLGGSADRGVFLTVRQGTLTACIKLILAEGPQADAYLAQWEAAKPLTHPNLVRVLESGRCTIDGKGLVYVVTEPGEAVLSGVTPKKALDPGKARDILDRILDALSYVHEKGFIHGHIKPSNILLVADEWKLSADSLREAGEGQKARHETDTYDAPEVIEGRLTVASDVWSLGMTMAESLMERPPAWDESTQSDPAVRESVLGPFLEIVRECLRSDPDKRCTIAEIKAWLARDASAPVAVGRTAEEVAPALAEVEPIRVAEESVPVAAEPASVAPEPVKVVEEPISLATSQASDATKQAPVVEESIAATADQVSVVPGAESFAVEPSGAADKSVLEGIAVAEESSANGDAQSGKVDSEVERANEQVKERVDEPVNDHFEPAPSSRMLANLEEEEHKGGFKVGRLLFGIVVLFAIVAVFLVRSHKIRLPFPVENRNAPAASQTAPKTEAGASQPESAVVPPAQSGSTPATEQTGQAGQSVQPVSPAPQSQPPASSAAGESKSGSAISQAAPQTQSPAAASPGEKHNQTTASPVVTGSVPTRPASASKAEPQAPASPEVANEANTEGAVVKRVLPGVSPGAISSMRGPVEVEVRLSVNKEGTVSDAEYVSPGPGNYFARIARQAARSWKFKTPVRDGNSVPSVWTLRFQFEREKIEVEAVEVR